MEYCILLCTIDIHVEFRTASSLDSDDIEEG